MAAPHSMQVSELESKGLSRSYSVLVPAAVVNQKIDQRLQSMGSRIKIPGFRPGHVPLKVLQQKYGQSITAEVLEQTVNNSSKEVMVMKKLRPAMPAKVEITDYKEGGELAFNMTVEVLPEIPEMDFSKITLDRPTYEVSDEEMTSALDRLRQGHRSWKSLDKATKAKKGNAVQIDFAGKLNGELFEGGSAKGFRLELGSDQFIPGFEDQLIGAKAGDEVEVKVSFPKDYHKEDLAGKPVTFDVTVHEVLEAEMPEMNDEFAKRLGVEDLKAVKKAVGEQLGKEYENMSRSKVKKQLFDYLEANTSFPVPEGMLELEFNSIWSRLQEAKKAGEPGLDKPEDELRKEYKKIAERRVRLGLLLSDISSKNKIEIAKEELSRAIMDQARMFPGQERKVIEFYQQNPAQVDELRGPILEEKAVDFILAKAKVNERKVSLEELMAEDDEESDSKSKGKKSAKAKKDEDESDSGDAKKTAKKK